MITGLEIAKSDLLSTKGELDFPVCRTFLFCGTFFFFFPMQYFLSFSQVFFFKFSFFKTFCNARIIFQSVFALRHFLAFSLQFPYHFSNDRDVMTISCDIYQVKTHDDCADDTQDDDDDGRQFITGEVWYPLPIFYRCHDYSCAKTMKVYGGGAYQTSSVIHCWRMMTMMIGDADTANDIHFDHEYKGLPINKDKDKCNQWVLKV